MKIISIIGPIGSGKSTFVNHVKKENIANYYYHEDVEGNKWLKEEPTLENLINCQQYIINHKKKYYDQLNLNDDVIVFEDASFYQDLYYVNQNFEKYYPLIHELITNSYLTLIEKIYKSVDKHTIIFIDLEPEQNEKNVKKRGRDFEQHLDVNYFKNQKEKLIEILKKYEKNYELIIYKPKMEAFDYENEKLEKYYQEIFNELGLKC